MRMKRNTFGMTLASLGALAAWQLRNRRAMDLRGQVVVVTGGSRGLGLLLAEEFAAQGARLAICARDPERLGHARERLAALGADVYAAPCDVRDRAAVERFLGEVTERFGRIDVLVNNAGVLVVAPVVTRTLEDFEEAMAVMFWGGAYATFAVLPQMRARGDGVIVNITSVGGKVAVPHLVPYTTAKWAAVAFSQGLHAELAPEGVSVVTVVPGLMRTGSYLNARFGGQHRSEFGWFSVLGNLPIVSIDARRAARRIVLAARRRETEVAFTPLAHLAERDHGLLPGFSTHLVTLMNLVLPAPPPRGGEEAVTGWESRSAVSDSFLTRMGRSAARRLLQTHPPAGR